MKLNRKLAAFSFSVVAASLLVAWPSNGALARKHKNSDQSANAYDPQVAMSIFPIQKGYDGQQFIVTKAGYWVSIPGLGVAPDATQIAAYKDEHNDIWYIDRHGAPVKLTADQVQWGMAQINQQAQARAAAGQQPMETMAPYTAQQPQNTTVVVQQQPGQSSSGVSALGTGLAAAGGAMAGAALSGAMYNNNYRGIPYGVPVYHNGGRYYYNNPNGGKVYVNTGNNNNYINQFNHQTNWQNQQNHQTNWQNQTNHQTNWQNQNKHATQLPATGQNHAHYQAGVGSRSSISKSVSRGGFSRGAARASRGGRRR